MTRSYDDTIEGLGVDSAGTTTLTIDRSHDTIDALVVEQTAGDATSYDVEASTDPNFSDGRKTVVDEAGLDPTNDPAVIDNGGNGFDNFDPRDEDGNGNKQKLHIRITANGGTNGGNDFGVRGYSSGKKTEG